MKSENLQRLIAAVLITFFLVLPASAGTDTESNPLSGFEWLIDGNWSNGQTVQEFSWGLNKQSVKARSFWLSEGKSKLVSEGFWFWHPREKKIKGHFFAIDMPFSFIESEAEFDGTTFVHRMETYSGNGDPSRYVETFEKASKHAYSWKLFSGTTPGGDALMKGDFRRSDP